MRIDMKKMIIKFAPFINFQKFKKYFHSTQKPAQIAYLCGESIIYRSILN